MGLWRRDMFKICCRLCEWVCALRHFSLVRRGFGGRQNTCGWVGGRSNPKSLEENIIKVKLEIVEGELLIMRHSVEEVLHGVQILHETMLVHIDEALGADLKALKIEKSSIEIQVIEIIQRELCRC